jgi:hypothetical protein
VGYALTQFGGTPTGTAATYHNDGCNLALAEVLVSAPFRQDYTRQYMYGRGMAARPTADPAMQYSSTAYASALWNTVRLAFDRPLVLPNKGMLEIGIGNFIAPGAALGMGDVANLLLLSAWINAEERGGILPGSSRFSEVIVRPAAQVGNMPWAADAWGSTPGNVAGTAIPPWGTFSGNEFLKQNPARGRAGGNVFDAINVWIDQIARDTAIQDSVVAGVAGSPVSPLALNVPCSVRTRGGGSGEYWWRPNAPLALMFNELTPALVYDLPEPITLGPGDCLDVALRLPLAATVTINAVPTTVQSIYQIGCAFTGFAVIEG